MAIAMVGTFALPPASAGVTFTTQDAPAHEYGGARRAPSLVFPRRFRVPIHWYRVYGQLLSSDLPFPELRQAEPGVAARTVRTGPEADPMEAQEGVLLGSQTIYAGCRARLFRTPDGLRIVVDDTGVYDLSDQGRHITWRAFPDATLDFARAHLLGRVLATVLHFDGALVLHGSAVSYSAGAVVFLAPKHTGKSTLALALTLAGGRLISDDTITVEHRDRPQVLPGVHSLRLLGDAAAGLVGTLPEERRSDGKYLMSDLPRERLETESRPLAAVYLLAAAEAIASGAAVARAPLPGPVAAAGIIGQGKVAEMLGPGEAPELLRRAALLASRVPVYQLAVVRDMGRLAEVTARMSEWHDAPTGAPGR